MPCDVQNYSPLHVRKLVRKEQINGEFDGTDPIPSKNWKRSELLPKIRTDR
jgi:hypothetical protein